MARLGFWLLTKSRIRFWFFIGIFWFSNAYCNWLLVIGSFCRSASLSRSSCARFWPSCSSLTFRERCRCSLAVLALSSFSSFVCLGLLSGSSKISYDWLSPELCRLSRPPELKLLSLDILSAMELWPPPEPWPPILIRLLLLEWWSAEAPRPPIFTVAPETSGLVGYRYIARDRPELRRFPEAMS